MIVDNFETTFAKAIRYTDGWSWRWIFIRSYKTWWVYDDIDIRTPDDKTRLLECLSDIRIDKPEFYI